MREVCELSRGAMWTSSKRNMYQLADWNINPSASLTLFIYALHALSQHSREFIPATDTINETDTF